MLHLRLPSAETHRLMAALAMTGIQTKLQPVPSGIALGPPYELPSVDRKIIAPFGTIANPGSSSGRS